MKKVDANNKACASLLIFRRYLAETYLERYGVPSATLHARLHINDDLRFDNINHITICTQKRTDDAPIKNYFNRK